MLQVYGAVSIPVDGGCEPLPEPEDEEDVIVSRNRHIARQLGRGARNAHQGHRGVCNINEHINKNILINTLQ